MGYDCQILTRPRFFYDASTPNPKFNGPMFTRSVVIELTHTNEQILAFETWNVARYATTFGN